MRYYSLSLVASLVLAGSVLAQNAPADSFKSVQAKIQAKQYAEAIAEAEQTLKTPDLAPNEKVRFLKLAAETTMRIGRTEAPKAIALYERIVEDPAIPTGAKVEALQSIANLQVGLQSGLPLHEMDLSEAHATLERALKLPDLKPEEQAAALRNIGKLYDRQDKFADARAAYQKILTLQVSDGIKAEAQRLSADTLAAEGKVGEAEEIYKQNNGDMIGFYQRFGTAQQRQDAIFKVLDDTTLPEAARWTALTRLPVWDSRDPDPAALKMAREKYLAAFLEKDPARASFLLRRTVDQASKGDYSLVEWTAPMLLNIPKLAPKDYSAIKMASVEALAVQGKVEPAVREAQAMAGDERVTPATRLWAQIVAATLANGAGTDSVTGLAEKAGDLPGKEKAEAILLAAKTALRAGNEKAARGLYDVYLSMLNRPARAAITCQFVAQAPYDVGSWLTSPVLKNAASSAKLDRPYGDNLEFLLATDSAVTGRQTGAQSKEPTGDTETDFHIVCDASGIHLFLNAHDARVADVLIGQAGGGGYEMYLAPGEHQAYYTFLSDLPKGGINPEAFVTMYPNAQYRQPSVEQGTIRSMTQPTDKGFATSISLSWELFYDRLPADGTKWQFESIRWTRSGGFSFGGSESVHNRNGWGDVVFSGMTAENLNAIKRRIVFKALARYQAAKAIKGPVGVWPDPVLGDPEFHQAKVEPLLKSLDQHVAKVKKDMTAAEVDAVFREAVPGWMELEYNVAAMRAEYLRDKHLAGAQQ